MSSMQTLRVAEAGHLDQDPIHALALDHRLDGAEFVDPARHDLDRLIDRLANALEDRRLGPGEAHEAVAGTDDVDAALAGGAEQAAERLREFSQLGQALLQIGRADAHFDAVAAHDRRLNETDLGLAQNLADLVAKLLDLLLADGRGIDLEQDMRATLQIETQHDVALRPFRPALHGARRQQVRNREHADEQRRQPRSQMPSTAKCKAWLPDVPVT